MSYNNYNNGQKSFSAKNISTDGMSFFNPMMMMTIRMLDSSLSINFRPLQIDENGNRKFPRPSEEDKRKYSILLSKETCQSFLDRIDRSFIPRLTENVYNLINNDDYTPKIISNGVLITGKSVTRVMDITSFNNEDKSIGTALRLINDIDANRIPGSIVEFAFDNGPVLEDYDVKTGEYKLGHCVPQLLLFRRTLVAFLDAITGGAAHSVNLSFKEKLDHITDIEEQIAIANKISITQSMPYNNNSNFSQNQNSAPNKNVEMVEVSSLADMLGEGAIFS